MSCTPKQIDLQAFFVTTAALLCQRVVTSGFKSAAAQYKRRYYLAPPQSILAKPMKAKLMLCKSLFIVHARVKAF